jgi:hypothetical protein
MADQIDHSRCANSNRSAAEIERDGACLTCDDRHELVANFGSEHHHVPCSECRPAELAKYQKARRSP